MGDVEQEELARSNLEMCPSSEEKKEDSEDAGASLTIEGRKLSFESAKNGSENEGTVPEIQDADQKPSAATENIPSFKVPETDDTEETSPKKAEADDAEETSPKKAGSKKRLKGKLRRLIRIVRPFSVFKKKSKGKLNVPCEPLVEEDEFQQDELQTPELDPPEAHKLPVEHSVKVSVLTASTSDMIEPGCPMDPSYSVKTKREAWRNKKGTPSSNMVDFDGLVSTRAFDDEWGDACGPKPLENELKEDTFITPEKPKNPSSSQILSNDEFKPLGIDWFADESPTHVADYPQDTNNASF